MTFISVQCLGIVFLAKSLHDDSIDYMKVHHVDVKTLIIYDNISVNKLAKARKTRTSPGTLGLKKFGLGMLWVKKVFGKYTFRKYTFGKYTFGKYTFWKIHFRKIKFQKIHFQKLHFRKIHFWKIHFRKIHKNNWGPLSSTFHVGRPETLTDWKSESVTDQPTDGRTDRHG